MGKKRPPQHQNRQTHNARYTYREKVTTDWIVHIDVDEFILPARPIAAVLDDEPVATIALKLEPFEAMHDPLLPDDIYTSREFRGALRHEHWPRRRAALGHYRKVIRDGMLSHTVGKSSTAPVCPVFCPACMPSCWTRSSCPRPSGSPR